MTSLALSLVVKATVVMTLALVAVWVARRSRASVRHMLLAVAFGVLLILPVAAVMVPVVPVTLPISQPAATLDAPGEIAGDAAVITSALDSNVLSAPVRTGGEWPGIR